MRALSKKKPRLSGALEIRELRDGTRLLKHLARVDYLALKPAQWDIIGKFDGTRTVENVLHSLLEQGTPPGIRAFYDLVLNALTRGFLVEAADAEADSIPPAGAPLNRLNPKAAGSIGLSLLLIALGSFAFLQTPIAFEYRPLDWLELALFVSLGLSLSYALAGAALTVFGRQALAVRLRWDRGLPFLHVDTRDAFMGGRVCETAVALRALAAPFVLALVSLLVESGNGLLGSGLTMLIIGCPFGATPAHQLLHALFRREYELPRCAEKFLQTRLLSRLFNWRERLAEDRYLMTWSAYAVAWLGVTLHYLNEILGLLLRVSFQTPLAEAPQFILQVNLFLVAVAIAVVLALPLWLATRSLWRLLAPRMFSAESALTRASAGTERPPDDDLGRFLSANLLFSQLPDRVLQQVLKAVKYVVAEPGATIIRERDLGDSLFIIHAGRVEVSKEGETGQERPVAVLGKGDIFGEIALLDKVPRTSTVRAVERTAMLVLGKDDFERLLVSALGTEQVRETIQICAFLRRHPLFADWHPQALLAIAHHFQFSACPAGQSILQQGESNDHFYLVYEGEFRVSQGGRQVALLGPGDFAGEISLLRESAAVADVVAVRNSLCLRLARADFLRFVSHDFLTGLAVESVLEERLARA